VHDIGTAATQSKQRWNAEHYTQVKISVSPELAIAFKSACAASNISMAEKLSQFMINCTDAAKKCKPTPDYTTKRQRRVAIKSILQQMELIRAAEERCRDNIPENLQGSVVFDTADECVSLLDEAIELLGSIY